MSTRRRLFLSASLVVMGGSAYLSTPSAAAQAGSCSDSEWYAAADRARTACGGAASFAGYCSNGSFVIQTIYCVEPT